MGWVAGVRFPSGAWIFTLPSRPVKLWANTASCVKDTKGCSQGQSSRSLNLTAHLRVVSMFIILDTNDVSRVLDASAHLLSRAFVSQSASELVYKVFSCFRREADAICTYVPAPLVFVRVGHFKMRGALFPCFLKCLHDVVLERRARFNF
jgi:hypothetical protein